MQEMMPEVFRTLLKLRSGCYPKCMNNYKKEALEDSGDILEAGWFLRALGGSVELASSRFHILGTTCSISGTLEAPPYV